MKSLAKFMRGILDSYGLHVENLMHVLLLLKSPVAVAPQRWFCECVQRIDGIELLDACSIKYISTTTFCQRADVLYPNLNVMSFAAPSAVIGDDPEVTHFFQSETRTYTLRNSSSIRDARDVARELLYVDSSRNANGVRYLDDVTFETSADGIGNNSHVVIRKIHKVEIDYERYRQRIPEVKKFLIIPLPATSEDDAERRHGKRRKVNEEPGQ